MQAFLFSLRSPETRKAYQRALTGFFSFCRLQPSAISESNVRAYRDQLKASGVSVRTIAQRLAALRSYFEYLVKEGKVETNPAAAVKAPSISRAPVSRALTSEEAHNILVAPDRRTVEGARDHALMLILISAPTVDVRQLRRREVRELPLKAQAAVYEYLRLDGARRRELQTDGDDAPLFQPIKNHRTLIHHKALSERQVQKIVGKWGEYSGVGRVTPRELRKANHNIL